MLPRTFRYAAPIAVLAVLAFPSVALAGYVDTGVLEEQIRNNYDLFQDGKLNGLDYQRMNTAKRNAIVAQGLTLIIAKEKESRGEYVEMDGGMATIMATMANKYRPLMDQFYAGGKNSRYPVMDKLKLYWANEKQSIRKRYEIMQQELRGQ